jgi:hypothetical protein
MNEGEYRFCDPAEGVPFFSTQEFHDDREAAPHIDQHGMQRDRLLLAAEFVKEAVLQHNIKTVTDVCCGDGGLLEYLKPFFNEHGVRFWGYDFQPANVRNAIYNRKIDVEFADVFHDDIDIGQLAIMTECLEHFEDPHRMVEKVGTVAKVFVASSPSGEVPEAHYEYHTWGWSIPAYTKLIECGGYTVDRIETSTIFQVQRGIKWKSL